MRGSLLSRFSLHYFRTKNTRKRELVEEFAAWGICTRYDSMMQISTAVGNEAIDQFVKEKLVCPTEMKKDVFTTGALDNIDHNPTSNRAKGSFHGTAMSLTNHISYETSGTIRDYQKEEGVFLKKFLEDLPEEYTVVPHVDMDCESVMPSTNITEHEYVSADNTNQRHENWAYNIKELLEKDEDSISKANVSWSAYFADAQETVKRPPAISALFPMFREKAATVPMIKHGMDVIQKSTLFLNPKQDATIIAMDQPLFSLAKKLQWECPDMYGEDKFVIMMGGLHIEMVILQILGQWLEDSGWSKIMKDAKVSTEGRVNALEKGSSTARGQWAHQVTFAALVILKHRAYESYEHTSRSENSPPMPITLWCQMNSEKHPLFYYWTVTSKLERIFLNFMFSQRNGDFLLYVDTIGEVIPWAYKYNYVHYARWLSVHAHDLNNLPKVSRKTFEEFLKGNFVTQKSTHKFSFLALDQIHEQLNKTVKGVGGVVGITEDESSLKRWMVTGPKVSSMLTDFQSKLNEKKHSTTRHHEQIPSIQMSFANDVRNTIAAFEVYGNPFMDNSEDLYALDTKKILDSEC